MLVCSKGRSDDRKKGDIPQACWKAQRRKRNSGQFKGRSVEHISQLLNDGFVDEVEGHGHERRSFRESVPTERFRLAGESREGRICGAVRGAELFQLVAPWGHEPPEEKQERAVNRSTPEVSDSLDYVIWPEVPGWMRIRMGAKFKGSWSKWLHTNRLSRSLS